MLKSTVGKKATLADLETRVEELFLFASSLQGDVRKIRDDRNGLLLELVDRLLQNKSTASLTHCEEPREYNELCRALLLSRERCDAAISLAIRRYLDVIRDQQQLRSLVREHEDVARILTKILNRYLVYHRQDLEALSVQLVEIHAGTSIDPNLHRVIGKRRAAAATDVDTVAEAITPYMSWLDANNVLQFRTADVIVFAREPTAPRPTSISTVPNEVSHRDLQH